MLTSTWFFLIFDSLLFTLYFVRSPPHLLSLFLHYSRYPKLGSRLIRISPHALGWGGRLQTPHASLTSQLSSAWSFHESTKLLPHPPHAEQRSKGTFTCKSTSGEGQLLRMCNGKKIACAPNMLHNKACRHFITQKYKMIWPMLPYRWILWTPKWCLRIILSYFAPDNPTGYLACATRWPILEAWLLEWQGMGGKFRGMYTLHCPTVLCKPLSRIISPYLFWTLCKLHWKWVSLCTTTYLNINFFLKKIDFPKASIDKQLLWRVFLYSASSFFLIVSKFIVFKVAHKSHILVIRKPIAKAHFPSTTK